MNDAPPAPRAPQGNVNLKTGSQQVEDVTLCLGGPYLQG